jgi:hypothetical protein
MKSTATTAKRITRATLTSFVRKNRARLLIDVHSKFDGMYDSVMPVGESGFTPIIEDPYTNFAETTLNIVGVWLVRGGGKAQSRNYFSPIDTPTHEGIRVSNCCGSFSLAVRKA